ncbi:MAG TPA: DUF3822 family protein [Panacibacter sp.]|nr:DUF3822 family protein [Panacibacter sp.]
MVQKTFGIYSDNLEGCNLFIETGDNYIAGWCKEPETKAVKAFELFSFTEADADDFEKLFKEIQWHSRLLTARFEKMYCIWGHEKCVCIPEEFYTPEIAASYIELMFGEYNGEEIYSNTIFGNVILSVLPGAVSKEILNRNNTSAHIHKYFQLIKGQENEMQENKVHIIFYHSHFILSVYKEGKLQLIKSYSYKAAEDVLYVVLNSCNMYEIPVATTKVYAGGLIDISSPLFTMLNTYLEHFSFEPVDKALYQAEGFHAHPLRYFASFCQYDV